MELGWVVIKIKSNVNFHPLLEQPRCSHQTCRPPAPVGSVAYSVYQRWWSTIVGLHITSSTRLVALKLCITVAQCVTARQISAAAWIGPGRREQKLWRTCYSWWLQWSVTGVSLLSAQHLFRSATYHSQGLREEVQGRAGRGAVAGSDAWDHTHPALVWCWRFHNPVHALIRVLYITVPKAWLKPRQHVKLPCKTPAQ